MIKTAKKINKEYKTQTGRNIAATYDDKRKEEYSKRLKDRWKANDGLNPDCQYKGEGHPAWKGEAVIYESWHYRHRQHFLKTYCERCGINRHLVINVQNRGLALHSIDGTSNNSDKTNWRTLCTSCHNKVHKPARLVSLEKKILKHIGGVNEN